MATADQKFADDQKDCINQQILLAIQCKNCQRELNDTTLYECSFKKCPKKDIYCKTCGNMAHFKIKTHQWKRYKKVIHKNGVNLALVQKGYIDLDLMIRNRNWSGFKQLGGQIVAYAAGTATQTATTYRALLYAGQSAKVNGQLLDLVVDVTNGVQHGSKALRAGLMKTTPWAIAAAATLDIVIHSYRFWKGDIESWKEFGWYCSRAIVSASGSGLSGWGGACLGVGVGAPLGPVGSIIGGIIGGLIGSIVGGTVSSKGFEKAWPNPNQKKREKIVREAVSWFHFKHDEIFDKQTGQFNENVFNKRSIMKRYRQFARIYHPDRSGGDLQKWNELQIYLGLLLALCEKNPTQKNEAVKCMKAIGI